MSDGERERRGDGEKLISLRVYKLKSLRV